MLTRPVFRDLSIDKTGLYGLPCELHKRRVERVTRAYRRRRDLRGPSRDIVVKDCTRNGNVTGIEIENSVNALVDNNYVL